MELLSVTELGLNEVKRRLRKPAFDEVELAPAVRERNRRLFGEDLAASELVARIVGDVRVHGDMAVRRYNHLLDGYDGALRVDDAEFNAANASVDPAITRSLQRAIANIRSYHEEQRPQSWFTTREHGSVLGQKVVPLDCVGLYAPGGTAAYPSSVLMNAVPAIVAGVRRPVLMCPTRGGQLNPYVLWAAQELGIRDVFKVGGAQAIAAMAFGTESVPRVDKITGPGNLFVTLAKKAVYGHVDIDMLAGPSEILIVADEHADPRYAAADLLSQAEHDPLASAILLTNSAGLAAAVQAELSRQIPPLPRRAIVEASLTRNGRVIVTEDIAQAVELANVAAPEHLELLVANPRELLPHVHHAGAVFMGAFSPEPLGDYFAGPDHILPTGGTARFYSVLSVETFVKRTSVIDYTAAALAEAAPDVMRLAEAEGLRAHANAIALRGERP